MDNYDLLLKAARSCHTKHAWEETFRKYEHVISAANTAKPISELFKLLQADPQSLQYDPSIWGTLLRGCISCWNLKLGREIGEYARKITSPEVAIPSAHIALESGQPTRAREIANRALRSPRLIERQALQLDMLVCSSYAEEGRHSRAIRMLNRLIPNVRQSTLDTPDRADFLMRMGRMHFFLGRYLQAGALFQDASDLYSQIQDWEATAKALFNTAACYHNSGGKRQDSAFPFIEKCRRLAEAKNLAGPLAHCEAFYGVNAYQHGDFAGAIEHLRAGLGHLPVSEQSFRRLHILSMLAFTYLATGRYHLAKKFGHQTLELAALDESERFKTRYIGLKAELLWEDGQIEESQENLRASCTEIATHGVHILEEMSTFNRYILQNALLGEKRTPPKLRVEEPLKKHLQLTLENQYAIGQVLLNQSNFDEALDLFEKIAQRARGFGGRFHECIGLLGQIQTMLAQAYPENTYEHLMAELEIASAKLGDTPMKPKVKIVQAASAYQRGDFEETERLLREAIKGSRVSFSDRFVAGCWLATIEGKSCRVSASWQQSMLARATRIHFAPRFEVVSDRLYKISNFYEVNLIKHPALADLIHYLLLKNDFASTPSNIQKEVWKQSLQTQGWQQKIRNNVKRLRTLFPYTLAPLIIQQDGNLRIFHEAFTIQPTRSADLSPDEEVLRLVSHSAMSSNQLANRLQISTATTKRILKRLTAEKRITAVRRGRNIFYEPNSLQSH